MTKRRLINKKAYDEMLLLRKLLVNDDKNNYEISLQIDENECECFVIDHYFEEELVGNIVGENYTNISKMIIEYLSQK